MPGPTLALLLVPVLAAAVPLLLSEARDWHHVVGRVGLFGVGVSAWIDLADNCGALCVEDDPPLLSATWAVSGVLVAIALADQVLRRPA